MWHECFLKLDWIKPLNAKYRRIVPDLRLASQFYYVLMILVGVARVLEVGECMKLKK